MMSSTKGKASRRTRSPKKPRTMSGSSKSGEKAGEGEKQGEEVPGDLKAFFGHPLVNGEGNQASALALLHEYQNLPALDHTDTRIRDRHDSFSYMLNKNEHNRSGGSDQYSLLMHSDVDAFLNISSSSSQPSANLESSPAVVSPKSEESLRSSGGILDASGSPKDTPEMNASPENYVDLPDLPMNSPPSDSQELHDGDSQPTPPPTGEKTPSPSVHSYELQRSVSCQETTVNDSVDPNGATYDVEMAKCSEETTHSLRETKERNDLFGLHGSHNDCPPVTRSRDHGDKQSQKPVSLLDKSVLVSKMDDSTTTSNGYFSKPDTGGLQNSQVAYISPQVSTAVSVKGEIGVDNSSARSNTIGINKRRYSLPISSPLSGTMGGEISQSHDPPICSTAPQNKYIQEFQDFVLKKESVSQLETALRAPRRSKVNAEQPLFKKEEQPVDSALPPPPPYTQNAFQGLNLPPISVICKQIQRDYPGLAGVPLAIIEKSLLTLGFPAGNQSAASALPQQPLSMPMPTIRPVAPQNSVAENGALQVTSSGPPSSQAMPQCNHIPAQHSASSSQAHSLQTEQNTSQRLAQNDQETSKGQSSESFLKLPENVPIQPASQQSLLNAQGLSVLPSLTRENGGVSNSQFQTAGPGNTNLPNPPPGAPTQGLSLASRVLAQHVLQNMALLQAQQVAPVPSAQPQTTALFGSAAEGVQNQSVGHGCGAGGAHNQSTNQLPPMLPPAFDSNLISSLVRNALFPQISNMGGNGPSHVILPKSLFNMATRGLIPVASPTAGQQAAGKPTGTAVFGTPVDDKPSANTLIPGVRSNEPFQNDCPTLTEYLKTHQGGVYASAASASGVPKAEAMPQETVLMQTHDSSRNKPEYSSHHSLSRRPSYLPVSSTIPYNHSLPLYQSQLTDAALRGTDQLQSTFASTRQPDTPDQMLEAAAMVTGKQAAHHQRNLLLAHAALVSGKNPEDIFNSEQTTPEAAFAPVVSQCLPDEPSVCLSGRQSAPPLSPFLQCDAVPRIQTLQERQDPASAPTTPLYSPGQSQVPSFPHQATPAPHTTALSSDPHRAGNPMTLKTHTSASSNIHDGSCETLERKYTDTFAKTSHVTSNMLPQNMHMPKTYQSNGAEYFKEPDIIRSASYSDQTTALSQRLSISVPSAPTEVLSYGNAHPHVVDSRVETTFLERTNSSIDINQDQNNCKINTTSQNKLKKKKTAKISASVAPSSGSTFVRNAQPSGDIPAGSNYQSTEEFPSRAPSIAEHDTSMGHSLVAPVPGAVAARSLLTESLLQKHLHQARQIGTAGAADTRSLSTQSRQMSNGSPAGIIKHELGGQLQQYLSEVAGLSTRSRAGDHLLPVDNTIEGTSPVHVARQHQSNFSPFNQSKSSEIGLLELPKLPNREEELKHISHADGLNKPQRTKPDIAQDTPWNVSVCEPYRTSTDVRLVSKPAMLPTQQHQGLNLSKSGTETSPNGVSAVSAMDTNSGLLMIKSHSAPITPPNPNIHPPYHDLKSPDSGIGESCLSPSEGVFSHNSGDGALAQSGDKATKRKRPFPSRTNSRQIPAFSSPERRPSTASVQPMTKRDPSQCHYRCFMDTPISASQKIEDDRITYMNKGQFYNVVIEYKSKSRALSSPTVKSVVMVLFRDDKSVLDEFKAWQFWHSRQHSEKQRILDIDLKSSEGLVVSSIEETSHNAISFRWNPLQQNAKISITINCLSTDFSNQKGVKGLPLHVQVDTFEEDSNPVPVHRAYCQVKVFCDKGAERKARDEERKKEAKCKHPEQGVEKAAPIPHSKKSKAEPKFHPPCDISTFYDVADLKKEPILFSPVKESEEASPPPKAIVFPTIDPKMAQVATQVFTSSSGDDTEPKPKRPRQAVEPSARRTSEKVLLYVRESHEAVFTALLLLQPTLESLVKAVEEKYGIPVSNITNVYKRSKKGILVKMDDNIVKHYSNESTFLIILTKYQSPSDGTANYDVTLQDLD